MPKRQPIIWNALDPANDDMEARIRYEDEHYDDEYEREKDEEERENGKI